MYDTNTHIHTHTHTHTHKHTACEDSHLQHRWSPATVCKYFISRIQFERSRTHTHWAAVQSTLLIYGFETPPILPVSDIIPLKSVCILEPLMNSPHHHTHTHTHTPTFLLRHTLFVMIIIYHLLMMQACPNMLVTTSRIPCALLCKLLKKIIKGQLTLF